MLSFEHLKHFHIAARDGEIGSVDDLYFDDATWDVRYLVVDTGSWLPGRKVLLVPSSFERPRSGEKAMPSRLTREQIRNAPDIDTDRPVERQHEIALHMYYGWPLYWGGSSLASARTLGLYPDRVASGERPDEKEPPMWESVKEEEEKGDPHLRGAKEVDGYRIEAEDGEIGHVRDFLIDENMWIVRYLVADTGGWFSGHDVLIAPAWIKEIRWTDERVHVDLKRETIASSPIY
ncbi:MAG: PRC-barrel domain-containing protein, partial [Candidatus Eisenbacteria bacterium]|nr:PRC-barrel domain-containing protein [Candidatus Eisenbacteria bacterium]